MKAGSDNFGAPSTQGVIKRLKAGDIERVIHELALKHTKFYNCQTLNDLEAFKRKANLIIANCKSEPLSDVADKVYTCDLFESD